MKNIFEKSKYLISSLEGCHQALKIVHWSTDKKSTHLLADEVDDDILEIEDRIAECVMGITGEKYSSGDIKTLLPNGKTITEILNDVKDDVFSMKEEISDEKEGAGLDNILDELLEDINKWKYLDTLS